MNRLVLAALFAASLGAPAPAAGYDLSIVGGEEVLSASSPEYRHTVRLLVTMEFPKVPEVPAPVQGRAFSMRCSGSLISPKAVLTAAHCLPAEVYIGKDGMGWLPTAVRSVRAFFRRGPDEDGPGGYLHAGHVRHPGFRDRWYEEVKKEDLWDPPKPVHDIAVVFLEDPVPSFKAPAAAADPKTPLNAGEEVVLVGFGRTSQSSPMDIPRMRRVSVPFRGGLRNGHDLYVGNGNPSAPGTVPGPKGGCFGDSGAPAYLPGSDGWRVVGIVARGPGPESGGCAAGVSVLTDVRPYAGWLRSVVGAGDGPLARPAPLNLPLKAVAGLSWD